MKKWSLAILMILLLLHGCAGKRAGKSPAAGAKASIITSKVNSSAKAPLIVIPIKKTAPTDIVANPPDGSSFYWPVVPTAILIPSLGTGNHLELLTQARDTSDIETWRCAARLPGVYKVASGSSGIDMLAMLHLGYSGRRCYNIYLWGKMSSSKTDQWLWKLLYVGKGVCEPKHGNHFDKVRFDSVHGNLELHDTKADQKDIVPVKPLLKVLKLKGKTTE